jgi:hypothetical protein
MRETVIADPMALGARALGTSATLGVGELFSDYEEGRAHALSAEHVEDVVGNFGLGPVVEGERNLHFTSSHFDPALVGAGARCFADPASLD